MRVIGLTGPIGCGKSTAAAHLETKGYERIKMAGALKDMMRVIGMTDAHIEGDLKEVPSALLCGKTPRFAMQTIGTEWGRDIIGNDIWCNIWTAKALHVLRSHSFGVVCDDVRFANEVEAVKSVGGIIIEIVRPGCERSASHASESFEISADIKIMNDGSIENLVKNLDALLDLLPSSQRKLFSADDDDGSVVGVPV